jgi:anti-sigma regulatory factor (Ser/Thr protein kinase)
MQSEAAAAGAQQAGGVVPVRPRRIPSKVAALEEELRRQRETIEALTREVAALRAAKADLLARLASLTDAPAAAGDVELDPVELVVPVGPHAPAAARAAVTSWLDGRVAQRVLDDARLLVSELVTNSLRHAQLAADAPIRISAHLSAGTLRVEVRDPGHAGSFDAHAADPGSGGYGLHLVELLATRWGVDRRTGSGTRVWVELALEA